MDSLCNCSDVWLQDSRLEQHVEQPSLFIKEEIMLQPQPHIDLLRRVYSLRNQDRCCPIHTQIWPAASFCSFLAETDAAEQKKSPRLSTKNISQAHQQVAPRLEKTRTLSPVCRVRCSEGKDSCLRREECFRGGQPLPAACWVLLLWLSSPRVCLSLPSSAASGLGPGQGRPRQQRAAPPRQPHTPASRQHPDSILRSSQPQHRAAARTRSCRPVTAPPPDKDLPVTRGSSQTWLAAAPRLTSRKVWGKGEKGKKKKASLPENLSARKCWGKCWGKCCSGLSDPEIRMAATKLCEWEQPYEKSTEIWA